MQVVTTGEEMVEWRKYHCYRVFDELIETFVIGKKSYITKHTQPLDLDAGLNDIKTRFVENYDMADGSYEGKLNKQFDGASDNTKIIFVHAEYLWSMPSHSFNASTKKESATRWFPDSQLNLNNRYYFEGEHTVAGTGSSYNLRKFHEICAVIQLLMHINSCEGLNSVDAVKKSIGSFVFNGIYGDDPTNKEFRTDCKCGVRNMMLHLSAPDTFESIVSYSDKNRVVSVFGHVLTGDENLNREEQIKAIREKLYPDYGNHALPGRKERWFFYQDDILPLWKGKKPPECSAASIHLEIQAEENAEELEGEKVKINGKAIRRSSSLVKDVKVRDGYTCLACGFHYKNQIVQAHHLDPLSERKKPKLTKLKDLVTLCPNCHYLAHHLLRLRRGNKYKQQDTLLDKLAELK